MTTTVEQSLRELELFAGLQAEPLAHLFGITELAGGQELWRQGQAADALYIVETGSLEVIGRLPGELEVKLATLGPRDIVGELALLDGGPRSASVRAHEPTRLLRLDRSEFRTLILGKNRSAQTVRRRLLSLACARLADRHRALAATLTGTPRRESTIRGDILQPPHRSSYLLRLPFFCDYRIEELDGVMQQGLHRSGRARAVTSSPKANTCARCS